ncbi:OmpA/MotB family protein [Longibacter salinarum]|nr:OmpA family protein [Longibacter salinarum]
MRLFLSFSLVLTLLITGCSSTETASTPSADPGTPEEPLQTEVVRLRDEVRTLRDSLQFYDDVDSGQYYRELRALRDQTARMTYELDALRDGGQTLSERRVDQLFQPASATLTEGGLEALKPVAAQLRQAYPEREVRVEGHSDDTPLGESMKETYPSNWELSTARAAAVVRALIDLSGLDANQFVAVGYGATRPVASNRTASGRRANRRVRVAVLPQPRDYSRPFETSW